jgi:uracil-DNA glycosylase family 4
LEAQTRETAVVVADLFTKMESTVDAYGPGAIKVTRRVEGTAFFPGGIGLWRTLEPWGVAPLLFPRSPLMILGHNFDKVAGLEASSQRGIELMNGATWKILRRYLEAAMVEPSDCFFTNVFVGLQPIKATGPMMASEKYEEQCRTFLHEQIKIVRPFLVVTLGVPAAEQYNLSGCIAPVVSLDHPYYAYAKGCHSKECTAIVAHNASKLKGALGKGDRAAGGQSRIGQDDRLI